MRRSAELAPLSREHHVALELALRLARAQAGEEPDLRRRALGFWHEEGREHFAQEEEHLLPAFARVAAPEDELVVRTLTDHVALRMRFHALEEAPAGIDQLTDLGYRLRDHVRFEERVLFPAVERALPAERLAALGALLH